MLQYLPVLVFRLSCARCFQVTQTRPHLQRPSQGHSPACTQTQNVLQCILLPLWQICSLHLGDVEMTPLLWQAGWLKTQPARGAADSPAGSAAPLPFALARVTLGHSPNGVCWNAAESTALLPCCPWQWDRHAYTTCWAMHSESCQHGAGSAASRGQLRCHFLPGSRKKSTDSWQKWVLFSHRSTFLWSLSPAALITYFLTRGWRKQ